jgi:hypothetical protein
MVASDERLTHGWMLAAHDGTLLHTVSPRVRGEVHQNDAALVVGARYDNPEVTTDFFRCEEGVPEIQLNRRSKYSVSRAF